MGNHDSGRIEFVIVFAVGGASYKAIRCDLDADDIGHVDESFDCLRCMSAPHLPAAEQPFFIR